MIETDETAGLPERLHELLKHFNAAAANEFPSDDIKVVTEEFLQDAAVQKWTAKQMDGMRIKSMDFRNGVSMELEPARGMVAVWVAAARTLLMDAENYSEAVYYTMPEDIEKASYSMDVSIPELPDEEQT